MRRNRSKLLWKKEKSEISQNHSFCCRPCWTRVLVCWNILLIFDSLIKTVQQYNFTHGGWMTTRLFFFVSCKVKIVNNVSQKVTGAVQALPDWTDWSRWAYVPLRLPSAVLESGPHWATVLLTEDSLWRPRWREADVLLGGQPTTSGRGATTAGRKIHAPAWKLTALFVHIVNTPPNTSHPTHFLKKIFLSIFFLQACTVEQVVSPLLGTVTSWRSSSESWRTQWMPSHFVSRLLVECSVSVAVPKITPHPDFSN